MAASKEEKEKKEPKVVVFGNEVSDDENLEETGRRFSFRRHRGSLTWGLFFILIGVLFLLSNFGSLPPIVWSQIAKFWPVFIILIGVDTLFGHSEISDLISSLIGLFIFATILGIVFLNVSPHLLSGFPQSILNYLNGINGYIQPR
jgi:hypothetical protein